MLVSTYSSAPSSKSLLQQYFRVLTFSEYSYRRLTRSYVANSNWCYPGRPPISWFCLLRHPSRQMTDADLQQEIKIVYVYSFSLSCNSNESHDFLSWLVVDSLHVFMAEQCASLSSIYFCFLYCFRQPCRDYSRLSWSHPCVMPTHSSTSTFCWTSSILS